MSLSRVEADMIGIRVDNATTFHGPTELIRSHGPNCENDPVTDLHCCDLIFYSKKTKLRLYTSDILDSLRSRPIALKHTRPTCRSNTVTDSSRKALVTRIETEPSGTLVKQSKCVDRFREMSRSVFRPLPRSDYSLMIGRRALIAIREIKGPIHIPLMLPLAGITRSNTILTLDTVFY
ncbi:hypothetical protein EVAR_20191_1 [Eumeta japonica]|uniref:Uncharacterized protein n=1 Tax=Eumeta variegata TaxID=151549 RepID=A0A4C1UV46_EUMVA|nr:hypothetical protein EVAR_20191_1 [Eumeta japonica]